MKSGTLNIFLFVLVFSSCVASCRRMSRTRRPGHGPRRRERRRSAKVAFSKALTLSDIVVSASEASSSWRIHPLGLLCLQKESAPLTMSKTCNRLCSLRIKTGSSHVGDSEKLSESPTRELPVLVRKLQRRLQVLDLWSAGLMLSAHVTVRVGEVLNVRHRFQIVGEFNSACLIYFRQPIPPLQHQAQRARSGVVRGGIGCV